MKGHYLVLHLGDGPTLVREYFPLTDPDETEASAVARWLDAKVAGRKRSVDKARDQWRRKITYAGIAHPTSWYREQKLGAFAPKGTTPKRRR